ncbi:MAG: DUF2764 domain-containing protein [Chitinivibrionia bacterium]|nr:DUF2764 domain-containing protein [Chitinivibrionia bacterium]
MSRKYYYLVTGLPNLADNVKNFDYAKIREEVIEVLAKEDAELVKFLLLRFDNENIINILDKKQEFDSRGWFSRSELEEAVNNFDALPKYLQVFLQNRKDDKESVAGLGVFEQLSYLYYKELSGVNAWFAKWAVFCADIQNVVAASNARELGVSAERSVIQINDNAEKIAKSRASDFGLGNSLSWMEQISKNINDPIALEEAIDDIYWKKVDELSIGSEFGMESVLGFMVKANSIERWLRLDTENGIARAKGLIENLKSSLQK